MILFHGMAEGLWSVSPERDRELDRLLAKRRRGVRRGRRVRVRGLRQLDRLRQEPDRVTSLLSDCWKQP